MDHIWQKEAMGLQGGPNKQEQPSYSYQRKLLLTQHQVSKRGKTTRSPIKVNTPRVYKL